MNSFIDINTYFSHTQLSCSLLVVHLDNKGEFGNINPTPTLLLPVSQFLLLRSRGNGSRSLEARPCSNVEF